MFRPSVALFDVEHLAEAEEAVGKGNHAAVPTIYITESAAIEGSANSRT